MTYGHVCGINTCRSFASQALCASGDAYKDDILKQDPALFKFRNSFTPVRYLDA